MNNHFSQFDQLSSQRPILFDVMSFCVYIISTHKCSWSSSSITNKLSSFSSSSSSHPHIRTFFILIYSFFFLLFYNSSYLLFVTFCDRCLYTLIDSLYTFHERYRIIFFFWTMECNTTHSILHECMKFLLTNWSNGFLLKIKVNLYDLFVCKRKTMQNNRFIPRLAKSTFNFFLHFLFLSLIWIFPHHWTVKRGL